VMLSVAPHPARAAGDDLRRIDSALGFEQHLCTLWQPGAGCHGAGAG
jgi:hypothetical protein